MRCLIGGLLIGLAGFALPALLLIGLAGFALPAVAQAPLACTAQNVGQRVCQAEGVCECGYFAGGTMFRAGYCQNELARIPPLLA